MDALLAARKKVSESQREQVAAEERHREQVSILQRIIEQQTEAIERLTRLLEDR